MGSIRFYLFGTVRVAPDRGPSRSDLPPALQGLLAFLLLNRGRRHKRDALAGMFWANESDERARSCLSTALWRLRKALSLSGSPDANYVLAGRNGDVGFNRESDYWLDIDAFEAGALVALTREPESLTPPDVRLIEDAVGLHAADAMEGFYDDWALRERERLRLLFLNSLWSLMRYHGFHQAYAESLAYGQRILNYDPLREEVHRDLIRLHAQMGQRPLALRQYEICRQVLEKELGVGPMPETQALFRSLTDGDIVEPVDAQLAEAAINMSRAVEEARLARRGLQSALELLHRTVDLLEQHVLTQKN